MKKGISFLFLALFSLTFFSCGNKNSNETDATESDSVLLNNVQDTVAYYGLYKGKLPPELGKGATFETTLALNEDNTFVLYASDKQEEFNEQGNYGVTDDLVTLFMIDRKPYYYKFEEGRKLRLLNEKKEPWSKDDTYVMLRIDE